MRPNDVLLCLNCEQLFTISRGFANRFAHIRYCWDCKDIDYEATQGGDHGGGLPQGFSPFSRTGKTTIVPGTTHQALEFEDIVPYLSWEPST